MLFEKLFAVSMAQRVDYATSLDVKFIECPICQDTYHDPRVLPCVHTYCMKCIGKCLRTDDSPVCDNILECPLCRIQFQIPPSGLASILRKNYFMEKLKDIKVMIGKKLACDICSRKDAEGSDRKKATLSCYECSKRYCTACETKHRQNCGSHGKSMVRCEKHDREQITEYCVECEITICSKCFNEEHQSHGRESVKDVSKRLRREFSDSIQRMNDTKKGCDKMLHNLYERKSQIFDEIEIIHQQIRKAFEAISKKIEKERQRLIKKVESMKIDRVDKIDREIDQVQKQASFIESLMKYTNEMKKIGTDGDVAQQSRFIQQRAGELQEKVSEIVHRTANTDLLDVKFEPTSIPETNLIGNIVSSTIRSYGTKLSILFAKMKYKESYDTKLYCPVLL